jgi:phenylpropionate dioxygenase-like ring-hydroxylating dioxygenase large terminal subunit
MNTDGRYRVAFPERWWYPACQSPDLTGKPLGITLMDTPLVLFRDGDGRAHALLDRCPHRNLPLSLGRVNSDGCIQCAYHGWRFDGAGRCSAVPGLLDDTGASTVRDVTARDTCEQDGFVWVWGRAGEPSSGRPFRLPEVDGRGSGQVVFERDLECTMHAAIENSLDVPHTAYLHRGLFRGAEPRAVTAVRRDVPGGVEVEYLGEPVAFGRFRPPPESDMTFDHWDRFFLPSIAQVEYRVKGWVYVVNTILHLPMSPFLTRAWFVVRFWTRVPSPLARPVIFVRGRQILGQDARVLAQQAGNIRRFGRERYTSTDLDLVGNAVWRLLREAEKAESESGSESGSGSGSGSGAVAGAGEPSELDDSVPNNSSVTFRI